MRRNRSVPLWHEAPGIVRFDIAMGLLTAGQLDRMWLDVLVGHLVQKVRDAVQARTALVVPLDDVPGADLGGRSTEHRIAGTGIVVPTTVRLKVHWAELPDLARVPCPVLEPAGLLVLAGLKPVLNDLDPASDECLLHHRYVLQKPLVLVLGSEAHDPVDAGAVVPR